RTKNASLGVRSCWKYLSGVSRLGGRSVSRIRSVFSGKVTRRGPAETELGAQFQRIAERAGTVLRGAAASVLLLDPEGRELVFVATTGAGSEKLIGVRFDAQRGIAGQSLQTRRVVKEDATASSAHFYPG